MAKKKPEGPNTSALPPTGGAVAIAVKQHGDGNQAPTVIAGGRGRVAEQILEIAFSQGIKVREDADLAQMLSVVDVDSEIPLEAFAAVAEILTYVYEANNDMKPDEGSDPINNNGKDRSIRADTMVKQWSSNGELNDD